MALEPGRDAGPLWGGTARPGGMKITGNLRAEVQAMDDVERAALEGVALKAEEFLKGGGKLYVDAAE